MMLLLLKHPIGTAGVPPTLTPAFPGTLTLVPATY